MGVQFNVEQGGLLYAPARDVRYGWAAAIRLVARRFDAEAWPELAEWLNSRGISPEEQCRGMESLCKTLADSCQDSQESMEAVLRRTGWFDVPFEVRAAIMAMLGTVCLGQLFHALRSTHELGGRPVEFEPLLHAEGDEARIFVWKPAPWWKRCWSRIWRRRRNRHVSRADKTRSPAYWPPLET